MLKIERAELGNVTVLRLKGDVDETQIDALRTALFECISEGRVQLVLNLKEMGFISYMGLGVIVERLRKVRAVNGDIKLAATNLYTERLFRMVGVTSLFSTFESEAQAVRVYQEAA